MSSSTAHAGDGAAEPDPRRWFALATLLLAGFMNLIDVTIVNVALPSMQERLDANSSQIEWVVAGYVLAFALGLLPLGRLGDIVGRRRVFLWGVAGFTGVSALCGLAPNMEVLVIGRLAQGFAAAMMMPQVLAITQNIFPPHERGAAFAMFGLSTSLAAVAGPLIGGMLVSADVAGLGWRPIFLINLPIGIFAVFAGLRMIPRVGGNPHLTNDWAGIAIVALALFLLVFPLIEGRTLGWPAWTFVMMLFSIPAALAFVMWERRRDRANRSQLLPLALMRNRNYVIGVAITLSFFSGIPGFFMIFALFLQTGFGFTPFESGLATIPFPIGVATASFLSGRLGARALKPRIVTGALAVTLGMVLTREAVLGVADAVAMESFILPLGLSGFGMGLSIAVLFQAVLSTVPREDSGSASGALQAFQQMGGALGIALIGEVFFATLALRGAPDHAGFVDATSRAMIYNVVVFAGVTVLCFFLRTVAPAAGASAPAPEPAEI